MDESEIIRGILRLFEETNVAWGACGEVLFEIGVSWESLTRIVRDGWMTMGGLKTTCRTILRVCVLGELESKICLALMNVGFGLI